MTQTRSMRAKQSCVRFPNECILMRLFYWHSSLTARPEAPQEGQQERKTHKHNKYCSLVQKFWNIFLKAFYCVIQIYNVGIVLRHCTMQPLDTTMHKEMTCWRSNNGPQGTAWSCKRPGVRPVGPPWQAVTFGVNFDYYLRYSQEGLLPCIMDVVSLKQGNYVQGENGFMSVCHLSKVVI